jgi:predicted PurR-regulated permease PerM
MDLLSEMAARLTSSPGVTICRQQDLPGGVFIQCHNDRALPPYIFIADLPVKFIDWIGIFCLIVAFVILWQFRQILLLVFTAVVLAIALNALVRWIVHRFKVKRSVAVPLALLLVLLVGLAFIALVLPPFIQQFQELIKLVPEGIDRLTVQVDRLTETPPPWFPKGGIEVPKLSDLTQQFGPLAGRLFNNFFVFFSNSLGVVLQGLLLLVLTLMLLAEPLAYRRLLIRLFPSFYRRRADYILSQCEIFLLSWLGGVFKSSVFVFALSVVGLLTLGVPFVFANALIAGVFNFIPNIGPAVSAVFPIFVAVLESPGKAIAVLVVYFIIQNLESYWFSPMTMKQQVSLLPAITLIAQIFFATFFGFLGLILALPLAVVIKTWVEEAFVNDVLDQWQGKLSGVDDAVDDGVDDGAANIADHSPADPADDLG